MIRHVLFVVCSMAMGTPEQSVAQTTTPFADWILRCSGDSPCFLNQTVRANGVELTLLNANVVFRADDSSPFIIMATPLGINLPAGVQVKVDGGGVDRLAFNTCTHEGCFVGVALTGARLKRWRRGLSAQVKYQDGAGKPVETELSLRGITAGLEALKSSRK